RCDVLRECQRPHAIAFLLQPRRADDVDRERTVDPSIQAARVAGLEIVTARKHSNTRARSRRALEHDVGQPATCMARDDDVVRVELDIIGTGGEKLDTTGETRPSL